MVSVSVTVSARKYRPIWVSVSDLNQNNGFSRTLIWSQMEIKIANWSVTVKTGLGIILRSVYSIIWSSDLNDRQVLDHRTLIEKRCPKIGKIDQRRLCIVPLWSFINYVYRILLIIDDLFTPCLHWRRKSFTFWKDNLHTLNISSTYLPFLVNIVKERPLILF